MDKMNGESDEYSIKKEEYSSLRELMQENEKYTIVRPIAIMTLASIGVINFNSDILLAAFPVFLCIILYFNLLLSLNRMGHNARISAYLNLIHEGKSCYQWIGWEKSTHLYQQWIMDYNYRTKKFLKEIEEERVARHKNASKQNGKECAKLETGGKFDNPHSHSESVSQGVDISKFLSWKHAKAHIASILQKATENNWVRKITPLHSLLSWFFNVFKDSKDSIYPTFFKTIVDFHIWAGAITVIVIIFLQCGLLGHDVKSATIAKESATIAKESATVFFAIVVKLFWIIINMITVVIYFMALVDIRERNLYCATEYNLRVWNAVFKESKKTLD